MFKLNKAISYLMLTIKPGIIESVPRNEPKTVITKNGYRNLQPVSSHSPGVALPAGSGIHEQLLYN